MCQFSEANQFFGIAFRGVSLRGKIDVLVAEFVAKMPTDLTQHTDHNYFWHTGNPVLMRAAANMQEYRPWEWIWMVAEGRSRGRDMCQPEHFWTYVLRHIRDHMFYQ